MINNLARRTKVFINRVVLLIMILSTVFFSVEGFTVSPKQKAKLSLRLKKNLEEIARRQFFNLLTASVVVLGQTTITNAGIDPSQLQGFRVESGSFGTASPFQQKKAIENNFSEATLIKLPSGVSYREYRGGKDDSVSVQVGSKVAVEMTIRFKAFNGMIYFTTLEDTTFDEFAWTIGSGAILKGLEEAMIGMHCNGLRFIEIPSSQIFDAKNTNQLPLPKSSSGKRVFNRVFEVGRSFETDATLIFEVLVTRIK